MLRIGLGALLIHPSRFGGAETYARQLIPALARIDQTNHYVVFLPKGHDFQFEANNFELVELPCPVENIYSRVIWEHTDYARYLKQHRLDLTHFLGSTAPYFYSPPSVVTMHDTIRLQRPDLTPFLLGQYYRRIQRRNVRSGKWVIAVSGYAASLLQQEMQIPSERISHVYHGIDPVFLDGAATASPITKKHLLWAGRMLPHKNVEVLMRAYQVLKQRGVDLPLFRMIGANDADRARLTPLLQKLGVEQYFSLESKLSHKQWRDTFPQLCREALIYCFPSKYESFGMPVLEAMSTGTAAVCADLPAFREVFGDHVKYCDADSEVQFANAIQYYLENETERRRDEARNQAFASNFTWDNAAILTLYNYRRQLGLAASLPESVRALADRRQVVSSVS
ncbi:glycosyltransferase family 1 protein [Bremerella cremea]|uniref:glycosyltransferase family 4 protein n=1 Tax=Bremerella cremea TaxID=1031537 RepID=UPI0031F165C7